MSYVIMKKYVFVGWKKFSKYSTELKFVEKDYYLSEDITTKIIDEIEAVLQKKQDESESLDKSKDETRITQIGESLIFYKSVFT